MILLAPQVLLSTLGEMAGSEEAELARELGDSLQRQLGVNKEVVAVVEREAGSLLGRARNLIADTKLAEDPKLDTWLKENL